jgi:acetylornithine deacetylase/succinyl-diaminopimelate desuccinylase-like protein
VFAAAAFTVTALSASARGQAGAPKAASLSPAELGAKVNAYTEAHARDILGELVELLVLPNVASDSAGIRRNAAFLVAALERRGVQARLLESPGSPPAVYGELPAPGSRRTLVLYAHYDGQPVIAAEWKSDPWKPVLRDSPLEGGGRELPLASIAAPSLGKPAALDERRLYARSASDDKAPIVAMLAALDAIRAAGLQPSVGLKFFFEGEEEAGSPHLRELVHRHAAVLTADAWLFCDGPVHQNRRQLVYFGVRGQVDLEMTVYGPARALHSGHYGNWAPNPIGLLTNLLASMRNAVGRVLIAGFYDGT